MSAEHPVYRHVKRDEWGHAIVVEELEDRTIYVFEIAGTKTLSSDYLHMVVPADLDPSEAESTYNRLAKRRSARTSGSKSTTPAMKPHLTFEQQIEIFLGLYPAGFESPQFAKNERGPDGGKKQTAISRAATELSDAALTAAEPGAVFETICDLMVLSKGRVSAADAKKVAAIGQDAHPSIASALRELLHGDGVYNARFGTWVRALKLQASWPVATLLPALVAPSEHTLVRPTFFRAQAAIIGMDATNSPRPDGKAYSGALEVAERVNAMLIEAGQPPRDLWDVYSFICKTANVKKAAPSAAQSPAKDATDE